MLRTERQSAQMSKIMNGGLTWSGTGCFIDVPIWGIRSFPRMVFFPESRFPGGHFPG